MIRTGPTGYNHGEIAWITTFFDRHLTNRRGHIDIDNIIHTRCGFNNIISQRPGNFFQNRPLSFILLQGNPATGKKPRFQVAKKQIRVGTGGFRSPQAITDRTGFGASTLGTHAQQATLINPADTAPTRSNGNHIQHR